MTAHTGAAADAFMRGHEVPQAKAGLASLRSASPPGAGLRRQPLSSDHASHKSGIATAWHPKTKCYHSRHYGSCQQDDIIMG